MWRVQAFTAFSVILKALDVLSRCTISTTVHTATAPCDAHIAQQPMITLRWITEERSACSQALLVLLSHALSR